MKRTSIFENGLVWFGAGVSIAEIITGTYFASLGFKTGLLAILMGHVIGCVLLFLAGIIGAKTRKSSMETVKMSFGQKGSLLFSTINVLHLLGWTSIMIYDGALAAEGIWGVGNWIWSLVIGGLIILWLIVGLKNLGKVNTIAMIALFIVTLILSYLIFFKGSHDTLPVGTLTFGAALELSIAMPLSWLPLISDYTKEAEKPVTSAFVSALIYGLVSSWMYIIGMGAALFTGESDIAHILLKSGLGILGLIVVVLSTVTTTFLDAWSAGVSAQSITKKLSDKTVAIIITGLGILGALLLPLHDITDFLYLIGSVFTPMTAVLITNFYFLKKDHSHKNFSWVSTLSWLMGLIIYRFLMSTTWMLGYTLPSMVLTLIICYAMTKIVDRKQTPLSPPSDQLHM